MIERIKQYLGSLQIDFVGKAPVVSTISLIMVLISWGLVIWPGPVLGIDFTGGTEVVLAFDDAIEIGELRDALGALNIPNDAIQRVGSDDEHEFKVRVQDPRFGADELEAAVRSKLTAAFGESWIQEIRFNPEVGARFSIIYTGDRVSPNTVKPVLEDLEGARVEEGREDREIVVKFPGLARQVEQKIGEAMGGRSFEVLSVDAVGPKVGRALRTQGVVSVVATLALILVYIAFRFDLAYAPGAVLALIHDVSVTMGLFVLIGLEFNLTMVGALLTIVGYSLNDTIVIYDRIRENRERYSRRDLRELVNQSINETLTRTIATSGTTLLSTLAFLVVGTDVIRTFVLAITCGIVFGTYSTIYVASPAILVTERLKPTLAKLVATSDRPSDDDAIPDQFLSESEKRRRERDKLTAEGEDPAADAVRRG